MAETTMETASRSNDDDEGDATNDDDKRETTNDDDEGDVTNDTDSSTTRDTDSETTRDADSETTRDTDSGSDRGASTQSPLAEASSQISFDMKDLGSNFIPTLTKTILKLASVFYAKLDLTQIDVDWGKLVRGIQWSNDLKRVKYVPNSDGVVVLEWGPSRKKDLIPFPGQLTNLLPTDKPPSDNDKILKSLFATPPTRQICYYVGPLPPSSLDELFPPCPLISTLGHIPGVNSLYGHLGEPLSGTAFHCEDANFRSFNLTIWGEKLWILVDREDTAKFENFVRQLADCGKCDQAIRHPSLFISPELLEKAKIGFSVVVAGPGTLVTTYPGQYHAVLNLTESFAIASNFLLPGPEPIIPPQLMTCSECGLDGLDHKDIRRIGKRPRGEDDGESTSDRDDTTTQRQTRAPHPKRLKPQNVIVEPPAARAQRLAAWVQSEEALGRFLSLVRQLRDPKGWFRYSANSLDRSAFLLHQADSQMELANFVYRYALCQLADELAPKGIARLASKKDREKIRKNLEWKVDKFNKHLTFGKKWKSLCSKHDGLLCFMPGIGAGPPHDWDLEEDDIPTFHRLLDTQQVRRLCKVAKAFQGILGGATDVEFLWESSNTNTADIYQNGKLSTEFGILPSVDSENVYHPERYPQWARPAGWPSWPADPTEATGCDFCGETEPTCICATQIFPPVTPRIKRYNTKGLGLQAVSLSPGQTAYKRGDWIGQLTGELVPGNSDEDAKWLADFIRTDTEPSVSVCKLYCGRRGNCFRLLNHSCRPSAKLLPLKVSGRWILGIKAEKDIADGSEITVSYGKGFFGPGCLCEFCQKDG